MSLRGATATRQSIWLTPARFAHFTLSPFALALLSVFFAAAPARAHDPLEAFHTATLHSDRLDLTVTMAQSTALKLITPAPSALTPENLAAHRPRLLREAATLFVITSVHTQLTARTASVELTEENDVVFRLTYPRPAPGRLFFHAAYFKKLGDGYGGILEINDAADQNLGWEQLLWARPNFELTVSTGSSKKS